MSKRMKIVYIAHPIGGDVASNLADLRRIIKIINLAHEDIVPFVPYYADAVSMNDDEPQERSRAMKNCISVLRSGLVDEIWLTGSRISPGMQQEVAECATMKIPVLTLINHF